MEEKQRVANERANAFLRKRKEQEEAMAAAKVVLADAHPERDQSEEGSCILLPSRALLGTLGITKTDEFSEHFQGGDGFSCSCRCKHSAICTHVGACLIVHFR